MTIELGQKVKDLITGFKGVVTGRCEYITGCNQMLVAPPVKFDGDATESRWFDEDRLKVLDDKKVILPRTADGPDKAAPRK